MTDYILNLICKELNLSETQVQNTLYLLNDGATIPFISRYRKEMTGSMDEVQVEAVQLKMHFYQELDKRKKTIVEAIRLQDKLSTELEKKIQNCFVLSELEDIYLPYKQKRKTKGEMARQKGLEGLAKLLMKQQVSDVLGSAKRFVNAEVTTVEDALSGARDIIAEWINEHEVARTIVRRSFEKGAHLSAKVIKGKEEQGDKYRDYFKVDESIKRISSHRLLAMRRAEKEGILRVSIAPDEASPIFHLEKYFKRFENAAGEQVVLAIKDAYKRLLRPAIETEFAAIIKEKADLEAIRIFTTNLRQLLLAPPLGQQRILAIDPGFRSGCKLVCLDGQGNLLHNETIYPHPPQNERSKAMKKMASLVGMFKIDAISIGNGTASRETEHFVQNIHFDRVVKLFVVSEAGASIYSASKVARDEFPQYDVTVRGAVSIGRRLMDPLAELVKIDPKSIGVGQYQHDVDPLKLKESLDRVVESSVNHVGVNLNTSSKHLLSYVSGVGPKLAEKIVAHRKDIGLFKSRADLMQVSGLGEKTYEQCAGFLRIPGAENPLDNSAVHPESYHIVKAMANDLKTEVTQLVSNKEFIQKISLDRFCTGSIGLPTLKDIVAELEKPGRDPRKAAKVFEFDKNIRSINDLKEGLLLPGIITNITKFGAFVDVGIKENGLVHVSEIADKFVDDPTTEVALHQHVKVTVLSVDKVRKRIALSMKQSPAK